MKIICVDDHPVIVGGLKKSVSGILPKAQVQAFTRASEALKHARENGCDLLLCEIELYNHGGLSLAEQIRNINPDVNIIFVTVCSQREHAQALETIKPWAYLTKPTTDSLLAQALEKLPVVC